jgi:chromosome segregation ATPase
MGRTDELEKASTTIKDAERRRDQVRQEMWDLDQEIRHLDKFVEILEANIKFLKDTRIIAMAKEFKKARKDLETANTRIEILKKDRDAAAKALNHTEIFIKKAKENHEKLLRSFNNNVVRGNFGSGNNGS